METVALMDKKMDNEDYDIQISHSDVTLRLADIQKRCTQLLDGTSEETVMCLALEDPDGDPNDNSNPYDHS